MIKLDGSASTWRREVSALGRLGFAIGAWVIALVTWSFASATTVPPGLQDIIRSAGETGALMGSPPSNAPCVIVEKPNVTLNLLADRPEIVAGESFELAVRFDLDESWHLYSGLNPGGIGLPTRVTWILPEGWEASDVLWPAPNLYRETSGDTSYTHEEELVLVTKVQVPADAPLGEVALGAELDYQVCKDKCIRGGATLELPLPVVATPTIVPSADCRQTFEDAAEGLPREEVDGFAAETAVSHSPLRAGDSVVAVIGVSAPDGGSVQQPTAQDRPLVVFERVEGITVVPMETRTEDGELRIIARVEASDELAGGRTVDVDAVVQVRLLAPGAKASEPADFGVSFAFESAGADAETAAESSELLDNVDVAALLAASTVDVAKASSGASGSEPTSLSLWQALLFAFIGGLILNIMPCVLPVLSLKALSLVEEADQSQRRVSAFVGAYVMGVLASFWALAGVVIALKYSGEWVGWGFQFQEPSYVLVMTAVVFAFALSMFGVFEVPGLTTRGEQSGLKGSFVHGILTTALSTPCSAPFLGPAIAFALSQSPHMIVVSFSLVGLGLATPIAALTLAPALRRYIPKPGVWMETFKHVIGFLLVGTVIWLVSVLNKQLTHDAMTSVLVLLGVISLSAWVLGRFTGPLASRKSKVVAVMTAAVLIAAALPFVSLEVPDRKPTAEELATDLIAWQPFAGEETLELARQGNTVFIDFTADWCATCKTMEATAIETDAVSKLIRANGIIAVKADLTRKDPEISRWVEFYGRAAIPLYVILPAGQADSPMILPEVITEGFLLEKLREAGPSTATAARDAGGQGEVAAAR